MEQRYGVRKRTTEATTFFSQFNGLFELNVNFFCTEHSIFEEQGGRRALVKKSSFEKNGFGVLLLLSNEQFFSGLEIRGKVVQTLVSKLIYWFLKIISNQTRDERSTKIRLTPFFCPGP